MSSELFLIAQIFLGALLIGLILLQVKGTGLGSTFGGELGFYRTKRGFEKLLFYFTIFIASLFLAAAIINILV